MYRDVLKKMCEWKLRRELERNREDGNIGMTQCVLEEMINRGLE